MKKQLRRLLGRNRYDTFKKVFRFIFVIFPLAVFIFAVGYGTHSAKVWYGSGSCDRVDLADLNPFAHKDPEALTDKELACLIIRSELPQSEWIWFFKTVYCESGKKPYGSKKAGNGAWHHGLSMISDLNLGLLGISNAKILYNPEKSMSYSVKLWEIRERQPWGTDSSKAVCMTDGPNMDGREEEGENKGKWIRDGWEWADPTFELYFTSHFIRKYHELMASIS